MKILNLKFLRGILLFVIGNVLIFAGVFNTNPIYYGTILPTTSTGIMTILGSMLVFAGGISFFYDLLKFIVKLTGIKTK